MFKTLTKSILLFVALWGLFFLRAHALDIPAALPNVIDPGQIQKNLEMETPQPRARPTASVTNKVAQPGMIEGGETVHFKLNKVIIAGNTVFTDEQIESIFASSLHKTISIADLQSMIEQVTTLYRNAGYILSRAILPPQEIKNGVVKIEIVEGFISTVTVTGESGRAKQLIEQYGQRIVQSRPLNISVMQHELLLANDLPGYTIKAVVLPSKTTQDAADLILDVHYKRVSGVIDYDNYGTRFLGPIQTSLAASVNSAFAAGDTTGANATVTTKESEIQYYNLYHTQLIGTKGWNYTIGSSYIATQPRFLLQDVDIVGESATFYGNLTYSLIRSRERNLSLHGMFNYQNVTSTILGLPLYQDRIRSLTLGGTYETTDRWHGSDNLGADVIQGLPIMGAAMHELQSRPKGRARYTRITAYLSRIQPLYKWFSAYTSFSGQYAFQPLLATEQFSVGGPAFGRGYGPSEIVGDRGAAGKIELRMDTVPEMRFLQLVEYYVFYDIGAIWNVDTFNLPARQDLTSIGLGFRASFTSNIYGELYIAKPLSRQCTTLTPTDQNPQQARAFFQLIARL